MLQSIIITFVNLFNWLSHESYKAASLINIHTLAINIYHGIGKSVKNAHRYTLRLFCSLFCDAQCCTELNKLHLCDSLLVAYIFIFLALALLVRIGCPFVIFQLFFFVSCCTQIGYFFLSILSHLDMLQLCGICVFLVFIFFHFLGPIRIVFRIGCPFLHGPTYVYLNPMKIFFC